MKKAVHSRSPNPSSLSNPSNFLKLCRQLQGELPFDFDSNIAALLQSYQQAVNETRSVGGQILILTHFSALIQKNIKHVADETTRAYLTACLTALDDRIRASLAKQAYLKERIFRRSTAREQIEIIAEIYAALKLYVISLNAEGVAAAESVIRIKDELEQNLRHRLH